MWDYTNKAGVALFARALVNVVNQTFSNGAPVLDYLFLDGPDWQDLPNISVARNALLRASKMEFFADLQNQFDALSGGQRNIVLNGVDNIDTAKLFNPTPLWYSGQAAVYRGRQSVYRQEDPPSRGVWNRLDLFRGQWENVLATPPKLSPAAGVHNFFFGGDPPVVQRADCRLPRTQKRPQAREPPPPGGFEQPKTTSDLAQWWHADWHVS
jgi:hypothetical protein